MKTILEEMAQPQTSRYEQTRSCLTLQNWYEYEEGYLERLSKRYRAGQLDNCLALINATSRFQVFDNLQPYSMQKEMFKEINYIFMHAFNDYVSGDSAVNPGTFAMDYFIQYAYVLLNNQVPIDRSVTSVKALFDGDMMVILENIYDNYSGLTVRQSNDIEFIMEQYSNGEKIRALPGDKTDYKNGEKLSRWGRLDLNDDNTYGVEFEVQKRNYAKITCASAANIVCEGNVILDVVEQPR